MKFLVTVVYCLLLPLSSSKVEANQYCSTQKSSVPLSSHVVQPHGSKSTIKDYQYAKGFYHADLNLETTEFKTVAEYVKRIVFPVVVKIDGISANLTIFSLNITNECNYINNSAMCTFWNETIQNNTECCVQSSSPCSSTLPICNCSHLYMDEIGFCPENVTNLTRKVTVTGSFKINQSCTAGNELKGNLTIMLASSYSNLSGFQCVKIHSNGNGSIKVDYILTVNGEFSSKLLNSHINDVASLIKQTYNVDLKSFQTITEGLVKMEISPSEINYKNTITITCTIEENLEKAQWFIKANESDEEALIAERLYTCENNDHRSESKLKINATLIWKGIYCCRFDYKCGPITHEACGVPKIFLLPDEITTIPSQYTLSKPNLDLNVQVKCCIKDDGENYTVTFTVEDTKSTPKMVGNQGSNEDGVSNDTVSKCWNFIIHGRFENSTEYKCTFTNSVNEERSGIINITVLSGNDNSCFSEDSSNYSWPETNTCVYAESNSPCESNRVGKIIRLCKEDGKWDKVFFNCTQKGIMKLLNFAKELEEGRGNVSLRLPEALHNLTDSGVMDQTITADSIALVKMLDALSKAAQNSKSSFNATVVGEFLLVVSNVTNLNVTEDEGNANFNPSTLMQSVETFSQLLQAPDKEYNQSLPNVELKAKEFSATSSDTYFQNFSETTAEIVRESLEDMRKKNITFKITSIQYSKIHNYLSSNNIEPKGYFVNSVVQSTSLKVTDDKHKGKDQNITIIMFFPAKQPANLKTAVCVFWDFERDNWSTEGCESVVTETGTNCTCKHLTSFAVLMTRKERQIPFLEELTHIGLGISIASLIFCIIVEMIVWDTVVKSSVAHFRHTTLVNTAIALLFAQSSFLIGSIHSVERNETLCTIATIFTHFFFLSVFFWTLTQSLTLLYRVIFIFRHLGKSAFMSFSFIVGYGCPLAIVIAATTSFLKKGKYKRENVCWLNAMPLGEFTAFYTFIIPLGCIIGINMIILTVVIVKLMRPSVSEGRKTEDKETIKKVIKAVLILTPAFGLTWIIGFALHEKTPDFFHYAFVLLNSVQGLFIVITASFTETKVRDAFMKRIKSLQSTSENVSSKASFQSVSK